MQRNCWEDHIHLSRLEMSQTAMAISEATPRLTRTRAFGKAGCGQRERCVSLSLQTLRRLASSHSMLAFQTASWGSELKIARRWNTYGYGSHFCRKPWKGTPLSQLRRTLTSRF